MNETETLSRHNQLKYRLRNRIAPELFECMPEEIQNFLIELDPADIKEAYLTTMLKIPWQAGDKVPDINLTQAKRILDCSHYAMTGTPWLPFSKTLTTLGNVVKEPVIRFALER